MRAWVIAGFAYFAVGTAAAVYIALGLNRSPLTYPDPWLTLSPLEGSALSTLCGVIIGALVVVLSRWSSTRFPSARMLETQLRGVVQSMPKRGVIPLALLSSCGEELLFRGVLLPWIGIVPQSLLFGILHQVQGPGRWVWVGWATALGLLFGCVLMATGSLLGPIVAHALVNTLNLLYLRKSP